MAQSYSFARESEDDLILVTSQIGNSIVDLVLDSGASHTFIDFGILIKEGFRLGDTKGLVPVETANGIIHANVFEVGRMTSMGITRDNFFVTSYLFDDPESTYRGVIGLDFLAGMKVCIDLVDCEITIHKK